jgi:hypothetical protein
MVIPPPAENYQPLEKRPAANINIAKGTEVVGKPWTIMKDNGAGIQTLNSLKEHGRSLSIFGLEGEKLQAAPASAAPSISIPGTAYGGTTTNGTFAGTLANSAIGTGPPTTPGSVGSADRSALQTAGSDAPALTSRHSVVPGSAHTNNDTQVKRRVSMTHGSVSDYLMDSEDRLNSSNGGHAQVYDSSSIAEMSSITKIPIRSREPPKILGRVLTDEEKADRKGYRERLLLEMENFKEQVSLNRALDKEGRMKIKMLQPEKLDELYKKVDVEKEEDFQRRDIYKTKLLKQIEAANLRKAAMEAARAGKIFKEYLYFNS